ncbi:DUF4386 family protein [candidate division KSB1 bacterium]|nr:DUF4386 family protein [candidate division KSB1 bacterium]
MNTKATANLKGDTRAGTAALVAGIGLLVMAVVAALANFGVIANLAVPGDPAATAANLAESAELLRLAAAGLIVVAILDVVVAWGLYVVLRSVNPSLSLLGCWLRLVYAAILAVAVNSLYDALRAGPMDPALTVFFLESFDTLWQVGLVIFGVHLIVVGLVAWQSGFIHWLFGGLLILAGVGYTVDGFGTLLSPDYVLGLAMFTFIGEVAFIFWLLIRGRKLPDVAGSIAEP